MAVDYSKIITDICKDILKLTDMFPYFIIAAVLITCFIYTIFRWHKKLKFVLWCLFIFYIEALLWITFFSREPGSRRAIYGSGTCFFYRKYNIICSIWLYDAMHFQNVQEDAGMRYGRIYILGYD